MTTVTTSGPNFRFGPFRLEPDERRLLCRGRPVRLTSKAFDTLLTLVERPGHLVTKEELLRRVWPDALVEENNLAQHISALRRVLAERDSDQTFIETVPKRGYRFVCAVTTEPVEASEDGAEAEPLEPELETAGDHAHSAQKTRRWGRRMAMLTVGALAAVLVAGAWLRWQRTSPGPVDSPASTEVTRIAVLPFLNLGSVDDAGFVAGLTEEISTRLTGVKGFAVPSMTTLARYDRTGKSLARLGADLHVEYVIEGSVRWAEGDSAPRVHIVPKLVRVTDDTTVWAGRYDVLLSDLIAAQADIAQQVANALQVTLDAAERRSVTASSTTHTDAYLSYLRGVASYRLGEFDTANQLAARAELERAVEYDPRFAAGWSWLARVYAEQYSSGVHRTPDNLRAAYRAAQTALDLSPGLAEGHLAMAHALTADRDHDRAREQLDIARTLAPNQAEIWQLIAAIDQRQGRWDAALEAYRRAFELDPVATADLLGIHYLNRRQYADAVRYIAIARAANRTGALVPDAWCQFSSRGDLAAARLLLETDIGARTPPDARALGLLARLEWFEGHHRRALDLIEQMDAAGAWLSPSFRFPASLAAAQVLEDMGLQAEAEARYASALEELEVRQRRAPEDDQIEAAMALAVSGLNRSDEALRRIRRALAIPHEVAARNALYLYFHAQIQARAGQPEAALATLDSMFQAPGVYNEWWILRDPWFASLRERPDFEHHLLRWTSQEPRSPPVLKETAAGLERLVSRSAPAPSEIGESARGTDQPVLNGKGAH